MSRPFHSSFPPCLPVWTSVPSQRIPAKLVCSFPRCSYLFPSWVFIFQPLSWIQTPFLESSVKKKKRQSVLARRWNQMECRNSSRSTPKCKLFLSITPLAVECAGQFQQEVWPIHSDSTDASGGSCPPSRTQHTVRWPLSERVRGWIAEAPFYWLELLSSTLE